MAKILNYYIEGIDILELIIIFSVIYTCSFKNKQNEKNQHYFPVIGSDVAYFTPTLINFTLKADFKQQHGI